MANDGFVVSGYDGISNQGGGWNSLPTPFNLAGIRPDAWGFNACHSLMGFAEAKSLRDIDNAHTRRQLQILSSVRMKGSHARCPLYIAVPQSGIITLHDVLSSINRHDIENIFAMGVPDVLLKAA